MLAISLSLTLFVFTHIHPPPLSLPQLFLISRASSCLQLMNQLLESIFPCVDLFAHTRLLPLSLSLSVCFSLSSCFMSTYGSFSRSWKAICVPGRQKSSGFPLDGVGAGLARGVLACAALHMLSICLLSNIVDLLLLCCLRKGWACSVYGSHTCLILEPRSQSSSVLSPLRVGRRVL